MAQSRDSVNVNLSLHSNQFKAFSDPSRRVMLVSGRRFGKSRVQLVRAFHRCLTTRIESYDTLSPPLILLAMPTLVMARRVLWRPLQQIFENVPGVKINKSEKRITVPGCPDVLVGGLDNYDSLRGLKIIHALIDESQDVPLSVLEEVIFPAMADTPGSTAFLTGTPKGKAHWFYKYSQRSDVSFHNYKTSDNPYIPRDEIERARATLPASVFEQEFNASFVNFEGRIFVFDTELHTVPDYQPAIGDVCIAGLDFGDVNPALTVIALRDMTGKKPQAIIIEAIQYGDGRNPVSQHELFNNILQICNKHKVTRLFCDPSRPAAIMDIRTHGKANDCRGMIKAIAGDNKISSGNGTINAMFHSGSLKVLSNLDTFCDELISYHRQINRHGEYLDAVAPGQTDHRTDSARYALFTFNNRNRGLLLGGTTL